MTLWEWNTSTNRFSKFCGVEILKLFWGLPPHSTSYAIDEFHTFTRTCTVHPLYSTCWSTLSPVSGVGLSKLPYDTSPRLTAIRLKIGCNELVVAPSDRRRPHGRCCSIWKIVPYIYTRQIFKSNLKKLNVERIKTAYLYLYTNIYSATWDFFSIVFCQRFL